MQYVECFSVFTVALLCQGCVLDCKTADPHVTGAEVREIFMTDECQKYQWPKISVDKSVKVSLLPEVKEGQKHIDCPVTFSTQHTEEKLLVTFESIGISCDSDDSLRIFDGNDDQVQLTGWRGICGKCGNNNNTTDCKDYSDRSTYRSLTLRYYGTPSEENRGITAILTSQKRPYTNGACGSDDFMCKKDTRNYCIAEELKCNGHRNCEDGMDEDNCVTDKSDIYPTPGVKNIGLHPMSIMLILVIPLSVILMTVAFIVFIIYTRMRAKRKCNRTQQIRDHSNTNNYTHNNPVSSVNNANHDSYPCELERTVEPIEDESIEAEPSETRIMLSVHNETGSSSSHEISTEAEGNSVHYYKKQQPIFVQTSSL